MNWLGCFPKAFPKEWALNGSQFFSQLQLLASKWRIALIPTEHVGGGLGFLKLETIKYFDWQASNCREPTEYVGGGLDSLHWKQRVFCLAVIPHYEGCWKPNSSYIPFALQFYWRHFWTLFFRHVHDACTDLAIKTRHFKTNLTLISPKKQHSNLEK